LATAHVATSPSIDHVPAHCLEHLVSSEAGSLGEGVLEVSRCSVEDKRRELTREERELERLEREKKRIEQVCCHPLPLHLNTPFSHTFPYDTRDPILHLPVTLGPANIGQR
jgi:hypothetical protein